MLKNINVKSGKILISFVLVFCFVIIRIINNTYLILFIKSICLLYGGFVSKIIGTFL